MDALWKRALTSCIKLQLIFALFLFVPAWSLRFWEAWLYWLLFSAAALILTLYFLKHDPRLIERRLEAGPIAEQEKSQKIIQAIASVLTCALFIIPGLDHRFHWSSVPAPLVLLGDVFVVVGFLIVFFVFKENSYTAGAVKVEADQQVISTGPYRFVRHPMYVGATLMFLATPFALGSQSALLVAIPLCSVIVARLLNEEQYLSTHLPGYIAYCQKVRYRLLPLVW